MMQFLHRLRCNFICPAFFFLFLASPAFSQVKFSATANETKIGLNDLVQIQFKIDDANSIKSIDPPSFKNFTVVSGPNQETGMSSINGKVSRYAAVSFILRPQKSGTFSFPPAIAIADGKQIKSNIVTIQVLNQGSVARRTPSPAPAPAMPFPLPEPARGDQQINDYVLRPGEDPMEKIKKNLFLKLEVNKTSCYVGEPVVASFKLYTRLRSETNVTDAPSFNGFSVSDMDVDQDATQEKVNGKMFNCYVLRKVQLYPLQAGTFTLTPLESSNRVTFLKYDRNSFGGSDMLLQFFQDFGVNSLSPGDLEEKTVNLKSNTATIHVKALPDTAVPPSFKGAVGNFSIRSNLAKNEMSTDDAGNLLIKIEGSGNMPMINAPAITWPGKIEPYDSKTTENINKQQVPLSGSKTFNIPFTVSKEGDYSIPPIKFSWFNPESGRYKTAMTEPLFFHVSKGKGIMHAAKSAVAANTGSSFLTVTNIEWISGGVLVGGILILLLFFLLRKKNTVSELETQVRLDDLKSQQKEQFEIPGNPLGEVHEKLMSGDAEGFYKELKLSLQKYLSGKLRIPKHELSRESVLEKLDDCNVGIGTTRLFESLMQEIELGLYAKHSNEGQMRNLYEKTAELVSLLNKQIC